MRPRGGRSQLVLDRCLGAAALAKCIYLSSIRASQRCVRIRAYASYRSAVAEVHLYVYVYVYVCVYVHVYEYVYVHAHVHVHVCVHVYVYVYVCVCVRVSVQSWPFWLKATCVR